jgi:CheY-like chemotaxis protein
MRPTSPTAHDRDAGPQRTILIADDEEAIRQALMFALEPEGYRLLQAEDGLDAVIKAIHERPDLILMDIGMPVMDGCQAAERIRAQPFVQDIPIVACTGVTRGHEDWGGALFQAVIRKPFSAVDVMDAIRPLLERRTC